MSRTLVFEPAPVKTHVTYAEVLKFLADFRAKKYQHLRYGQAFLNTLLPAVTDPDLFYCESKKVAHQIVVEKYCRG